MIVIFVLIGLSLGVATVFLAGFIWSVRSGQYEDTCTPAMRVLADDPPTGPGVGDGNSKQSISKQT